MYKCSPLVSVIIPTYGRPNLLLRAINSVLNQSYQNIEIIVVDDNNKDSINRKETEDVLKGLIAEKKIIYKKMDKNSGGAIARNFGVKFSKGELICFLDDDDEFLPCKIKLQVNKFLKSNLQLAIVGGFANIYDDKGNLLRIEANKVKGDVFKIQLGKNICTTCDAMINKDVFLKAGGFSDVPSSQEHTLFIKIFNINPFYDYVDVPVVNIYHHGGERISTSKRKAEGAIILHKFVSSFYNLLTDEEREKINSAHFINIIIAYMNMNNNRRNALKYFLKLLKSKKKIDKDVLKSFIIIIFGINLTQTVKGYINRKIIKFNVK
jgi:glycosyltransferase involved in cell wall biosynthesis